MRQSFGTLSAFSAAVFIAGCGSGDYDPSNNPNNDANWKARSIGIDEVFHQIPAGSSLPDSAPKPDPICAAIDVDGDGNATDSKKTVLEFESDPNIGKFSVYVYLNETDCAGLQPDYLDQLQFSYTIYSGNFEFNRIDSEMIGTGRIINTQAAANLLNQEQACGKNDWAVSTELSSINNCLAENKDSIHGFQHDEDSPRKAVGDKMEGLYCYVGNYFTYRVGKEGERPSASDIADYTGSDLTGDPLFVTVD